jgi:hypothetical protein
MRIAEEFYSCQTDAIAILHGTAIRHEICCKLETAANNLEPTSTSFMSVSEGNIDEQRDQPRSIPWIS